MRRLLKNVLAALAASVLLIPAAAYAQTGSISGNVRDASAGALPGVTVEVTSPALIEKVRSTQSDGNGRYQITALPVGTYKVTFTLQGFSVVSRENVVLTSDFTANVNADMKVGDLKETITVSAEAPVVDVANARQQQVFRGEEIRDLPTARNVPSLMVLVPGISSSGFNGNVCNGGVGVFCSPNITNFNAHNSVNDADGLSQGRLLIDGIPINTGSTGLVTGVTGSYVADIANAQEITFTLSGALGESETGGASINLVPRTGGNRYSGNYFTSYTDKKWFDYNNGSRIGNQPALLLHDHDVSGAFGGPIVRDRLWFFLTGRDQGKESSQTGGPMFYNANEGLWGANYAPDRTRDVVTYTNVWRNASANLTLQATPKNKFSFFWDEQDSCQDPCDGAVSSYVSPEAWFSVMTRPNHLARVSWNNPFTNRLLLEGGLSVVQQHADNTKHRFIQNPQDIPRVEECGTGIGSDSVTGGAALNPFIGQCAFGWGGLTGSNSGGSNRNIDQYRSRLAASYITGSHNAKVGFDGSYFSEINRNAANNLRLSYRYDTPAATCQTGATPPASLPTGVVWCGNTSLYYPQDPLNLARRAVPTRVTINTGPRQFDETVWTNSMYVQDQWTVNRFTLSGALRYDQAKSRFGETCVGPDIYVITPYCTPEADGVSFQDITPRWGATWDIFGNGKTALKWNMGKYLGAASIGGIYNAANPARRTVNSYQRNWVDGDGDRRVDCDLLNFSTNTVDLDTCGTPIAGQDSVRYGRDPYGLDEAGLPIGLQTTQCGRTETGIPAAVLAYCDRSGQNLLEGWQKRRTEWQLGIGIQHELLPRLSMEVTYNRRWYGNQQLTDTLGQGCDQYQDGTLTQDCVNNAFEFRSPNYNFYSIQAPLDPRLPGGGGYLVQGIDDRNTVGALTNNGAAVVLTTQQVQVWRGVDTNFTLRARGGLRISGGTSTGSQYTDNCKVMVNGPSVQRAGNGDPSCLIDRPFQTNVRGSATYTIPWADVLVSTVFQYRPGVERSATWRVNNTQAIWAPDSQWRATYDCGSGTIGCFFGQVNATSADVNLLNAGQLYGEGLRLFDLKLAKNIRFLGKRVNLGVDVYNLFNSDAALGYNNTYAPQTFDAFGNPTSAENNWGQVNNLTSPRFARFQVQFDF